MINVSVNELSLNIKITQSWENPDKSVAHLLFTSVFDQFGRFLIACKVPLQLDLFYAVSIA